MEKNELWQLVLEKIKGMVTEATYNSFITPVIIREISENPNIAYLSTSKDFIANVLKKRYVHLFEESISDITGEKYRVIIKTTSEYTAQNENMEKSHQASSRGVSNFTPQYTVNPLREIIFDPNYTFDNFVVGECNKYAHAVSVAVSKNPYELYNPVFIHGKSGLGKTHLLNSIGIYLLEHNQNIKVLYVDAESFSQDFIMSMNEGKTHEFDRKYREVDVLLVDDIQFLEGKVGFQEKFYYTFNALYNNNKQIIISGDRPPSKLTQLDERLRSRFAWNMVAEVQAPDYETRVAILLKKANNLNVEVDEDISEVINLVANKIVNNVRDMEGAFKSVIAFSQLTGEKVDIDFAKMVLKDIVISNDIVTPEKIKSAVCKYFKIKVSDLDTETRKMSIAYPRQIAMYLCRSMTDYSLPKIGGIFGNKHYSTVKHACDKIEDEIKINKELSEDIENIKANILS